MSDELIHKMAGIGIEALGKREGDDLRLELIAMVHARDQHGGKGSCGNTTSLRLSTSSCARSS